MRGEVVPSRPEMSRSMAISAKIPSVMPVELTPPENSKCGGQKMTHYGFYVCWQFFSCGETKCGQEHTTYHAGEYSQYGLEMPYDD